MFMPEAYSRGILDGVYEGLPKGFLNKESKDKLQKLSMGEEVDVFAGLSAEELKVAQKVLNVISGYMQARIDLENTAMEGGAAPADAAMMATQGAQEDPAIQQAMMEQAAAAGMLPPEAMQGGIPQGEMPVDPAMAEQGTPVLDQNVPVV